MPYTPWTGRSVGVEMEMRTVTRDDQPLTPQMLSGALQRSCHTPVNDRAGGWGHSDGTRWDVKRDGSCGHEIASPILAFDEDGECAELRRACTALAALNPKIDRACGLHVHVDLSDFSWEDLQRLVTLWCRYEPFFFSLLPNSRLANTYCKPIRKAAWNDADSTLFASHREAMAATNDRSFMTALRNGGIGDLKYRSLKTADWWMTKRVEFRLHSGTVDYKKIRNWCLLLLALVERARAERVHGAPRVGRGVRQAEAREGFSPRYVLKLIGLRTSRWVSEVPAINAELEAWVEERIAFFAPTRPGAQPRRSISRSRPPRTTTPIGGGAVAHLPIRDL